MLKVIGILLVLLVLAGVGLWYSQKDPSPTTTEIAEVETKETPKESPVPLYISSGAMHPNYVKGQHWYGDREAYKISEPQRGDVVVFIDATLGDKELIKRVIGTPGEEIGIKDGRVYINGNILDEPYLTPGTRTVTLDYPKEGESVVIPQGSYYLLGDNRPASADSRLWGFVPRKNITGKVTTCYENCK